MLDISEQPLPLRSRSLSYYAAIFSLYYKYLARRVSASRVVKAGNPEEIQVAYTRLLKTGLASLPEEGGDIETLYDARPGSPAESIEQLKYDDPRAQEFRNSIRTWFCKVPWSSIKRLEMQQWLYWAIFNAELPALHQVSEPHMTALEEALALLQKRLGCTIEEGSNPDVVPMRLTIDDTTIHWRPLTFYLSIRLLNWCLRQLYQARWKVQFGKSHDIEYMLRMPAEWNPVQSPRPIVFLHGLGVGLLQYHNVVAQLLNDFPDRPILIPLQPQISQDIFHPKFLQPPGRHQMAKSLAHLLQAFGWVRLDKQGETAGNLKEGPQRGVTVLSHSNGSYVHAWLLKAHPHIVGRSCFVDPVTFCSWEGDVCYNFFYRPCMTGIELLMRYFVATELGVSNLLQRHFCWTSNSLWFEEIPDAIDPMKTLFLLGGKDDIIHAERTKRYLASHGVRKNILFDPNGRHGQALLHGDQGLNDILEWLSNHEK